MATKAIVKDAQYFASCFSDLILEAKAEGHPFYFTSRKPKVDAFGNVTPPKGVNISMLAGKNEDGTADWRFINYDRNSRGYELGEKRQPFIRASTSSRTPSTPAGNQGADNALDSRMSKMEDGLAFLIKKLS